MNFSSAPLRNTTNVNCVDQNSTVYFAVVTFFSSLLNLLLLYFIKFETHLMMKPYRKIFYMGAVLDLLTSASIYLTQVRLTNLGEREVLTMCMDGWLPQIFQHWKMFEGGRLNYILIFEYTCCYMVLVYSAVLFVVRYIMIVWNHQLKALEFGLLMFLTFAITCLTSVAITYVAASSYDFNQQFIPIGNSSCTRMLPQVLTSVNLNDTTTYRIYTAWFYVSTSFEYSFLVVAACGLRVYLFLSKQAQVISATNRSIQRQIALTIGIQAANPFLVYFMPSIAIKAFMFWPDWEERMYQILCSPPTRSYP
ncbi:hypothetical protein M3Y99_00835200 [Aphelenchoides fujianensis]|nr:hypothetical protein M3Y99_00835200 [Aphelenchoides fujianensis]